MRDVIELIGMRGKEVTDCVRMEEVGEGGVTDRESTWVLLQVKHRTTITEWLLEDT